MVLRFSLYPLFDLVSRVPFWIILKHTSDCITVISEKVDIPVTCITYKKICTSFLRLALNDTEQICADTLISVGFLYPYAIDVGTFIGVNLSKNGSDQIAVFVNISITPLSSFSK